MYLYLVTYLTLFYFFNLMIYRTIIKLGSVHAYVTLLPLFIIFTFSKHAHSFTSNRSLTAFHVCFAHVWLNKTKSYCRTILNRTINHRLIINDITLIKLVTASYSKLLFTKNITRITAAPIVPN